jgi:hypothetical protein
VDIGLDGGGSEEGLAQAAPALVVLQDDPDDVGELVQPQRLDGGDHHGVSPLRQGMLARPAAQCKGKRVFPPKTGALVAGRIL